MRAPTRLLPRIISLSLLICLLTLLDAAPFVGAASAQGISSRSGTSQSGVLSAALGEPRGGAANRSAARRPSPPAANRSAAAQRTKGLVPQFMAALTGAIPEPQRAARRPARSNNSMAAAPQTRPTSPANQPAYRTAAAAQSYRFPGAADNTPPAARTRSTASRATATTTRNLGASRASLRQSNTPTNSRPTARPAERGGAPTSAAAAALIRAHQWAETASNEAEYTKVFLTCRQVATSPATAEEVAFAKALASWALNRRGQIKAAAGQTEQALADFSTAVKLDPDRWRAIHNRGVLLAQSGQFEQAFEDFHRTTELNPQFAKAFSNRAALYTFAGDPEAALRDYQRAIELDPQLAVAQRGLGRTCHLLGMTGEALECLDTAVTLEPNDPAALTSRGDLLTDLGYYADAANDYERALEVNAGSVDACRSSAWLLATCPDETIRNPDLALERASMAMERARNVDAETYNVLAAAQASAGDYRQAAETIRQAIDQAPASERALYEDRLEMYRQSQPLRIAPLGSVQQAQYQR